MKMLHNVTIWAQRKIEFDLASQRLIDSIGEYLESMAPKTEQTIES